MESTASNQLLDSLLNEPSLFNQALIFVFGLIIGSFVSLLSHRLATNEPIFLTRSKCPKCHSNLKARSLIPLLSYMLQRGKCLKCKAKISWIYPAIELACGLGFLLSFLALNSKINGKTLLYLAIFSTLMVMIITDLRHYFIPDSSQYVLAVLGALLVIYNQNLGNFEQEKSFLEIIAPAFIYLGFSLLLWLLFYFSARLEAIGIDDLKLFFICGLMLGMQRFLIFIFLCGILGSIFGSLWQKFKKDETFPFAPAICCALYLCLIFVKPTT